MPRIGLACIAVFPDRRHALMHNFWDITDPAQRMNEIGNFTKNLA
jgi:hypothetical protein